MKLQTIIVTEDVERSYFKNLMIDMKYVGQYIKEIISNNKVYILIYNFIAPILLFFSYY